VPWPAFAALALPNAQAAQTSGTAKTAATVSTASTAATQTASTPKPVLLDGTALVAGPPPAGDGLTTKSSLTNVVRYNKLYKTGAVTPSKCKEVNVSLRTTAGVVAYDTQLFKCIYASWALPLKQAGAAYKVAPKLVIHNSKTVQLAVWRRHRHRILLRCRPRVHLHPGVPDHQLLEAEPDLGAGRTRPSRSATSTVTTSSG